jgi:hypothetical protein
MLSANARLELSQRPPAAIGLRYRGEMPVIKHAVVVGRIGSHVRFVLERAMNWEEQARLKRPKDHPQRGGRSSSRPPRWKITSQAPYVTVSSRKLTRVSCPVVKILER